MSNAAELINIMFGGKSFRCSRRCAAHLTWTAERLERRHPNARIVVIQGSYSTNVAASAGTHDFDSVLDFQIVGMEWRPAERFLRECGWAAWYRFPPTFTHHLHAVSLGYPGRVGIYVPGQVDDYYRHALGLKGQHNSGSDPSWHPADIDKTIFDYPEWEAANMPLNKDDMDKIEALLDRKLADLGDVKIDVGKPNKWALSRVLTALLGRESTQP